ncbi:MAG: taurine catabolism dioxygenase TauD [Gemmatimonadetes bacterium]|nr:taurine catabolism dioxygenase TauD [Gemmatimonadota bacterium]
MAESGTRVFESRLMSKLLEPIGAPRGWTAVTAGTLSDWTFPVQPALVDAYASGTADELDASRELIADWEESLSPVRRALDSETGFALLDRVPIEDLTEAEAKRVYWRVGQTLGTPIEQNIQGTMLYDVRDTGQDVSGGARFSVTNAESSFHTDAAFADTPPEYVGLLSLKTAMTGGASQLVSAYALHNALLEEAPEAVDLLYESFLFDRRGQFREGEPELMVAPVFRWDGEELDTRYLHYYITEGHRSGDPLTSQQEDALEEVVEIVSRPDMRVEFTLEPGQMMFTNNHWILHNRTAFEDHPEPDRRRHCVRLWLKRQGTTDEHG